MLPLENLTAFVLGALLIYVMFRSMGIFVFVICISLVGYTTLEAKSYFWNSSTSQSVMWNITGFMAVTQAPESQPITVDIGTNTTLVVSLGGGRPATASFVDGYNYFMLPSGVITTIPIATDVWPSTEMGLAFGFTVCGFGWILRMARKTADLH